MDCDGLRDDQWERIRAFVAGGTKGKRGPRTDNRKFLDALLWMARSGGRWRDLPERLGDYRSVKRRYYRWIEMGVLDDIVETLAREAASSAKMTSRSLWKNGTAVLRLTPVKSAVERAVEPAQKYFKSSIWICFASLLRRLALTI
ncbi:hypothetical protein BG36_20295 [Aquamicrobium defluvii]|uniref:Insertion element IS402-like domain-containing protein n=1 Tax=Aquamicrobium defluvii TaxID=69279 RepID=A0A011TBK1_9HYPH|nr:hypothetical protein BG36_20295 [Aquamicrobium defluvii]